ncbi:MAG: hypothetical protein ACRD0D_03125, partial [Acidimicrobiales bacterium]
DYGATWLRRARRERAVLRARLDRLVDTYERRFMGQFESAQWTSRFCQQVLSCPEQWVGPLGACLSRLDFSPVLRDEVAIMHPGTAVRGVLVMPTGLLMASLDAVCRELGPHLAFGDTGGRFGLSFEVDDQGNRLRHWGLAPAMAPVWPGSA